MTAVEQPLTSLCDRRARFFELVASQYARADANLLLLTHLLPDRPEFVDAISHVLRIARIVAVPYSVDSKTLTRLSGEYDVVAPALDTLEDPVATARLVDSLNCTGPIVILEVGGYFASALEHVDRASDVIGIVEETEAGHRRYAAKPTLRWPVISVARSELKACEDALVGASCLFSLEKLLRHQGMVLENWRALVLGYGRIGQSIAYALRNRHCTTTVYDSDPIRRCLAHSHGFLIPSKEQALRTADIVFGATGEQSLRATDFGLLRDGAILTSCSSRDIEFDLAHLASEYCQEGVCEGLDVFERDGHRIFLVASGYPVNFLDGAVLGPTLALVQAEAILAIQMLLRDNMVPGIHALARNAREEVAANWIRFFCDSEIGRVE